MEIKRPMINSRIFYAALVVVAVIALAYLAGDIAARGAPSVGLNSPTTFPVDI